ncbi:hypothetical protein V1527DRAFT_416634 [Lipomyces starkeyi]
MIFPRRDITGLRARWQIKGALYFPDAVDNRARKVRHHLAERIVALKSREKRDIVVVAPCGVAGWRSYTIEDDEKGSVALAPIE